MATIPGKKRLKGKFRKRHFRRRLERNWPRKYIPPHTENRCPFCGKHLKNIEAHIKAKHRAEKPKQITGKEHGHDRISPEKIW